MLIQERPQLVADAIERLLDGRDRRPGRRLTARDGGVLHARPTPAAPHGG